MSLVKELQSEALKPDVRIGDLLRKALVVASKLKLEEFRQWCELELEGYRDNNVPEYRKTRGQVVIVNPSFGPPKPMMFEDHELSDVVTLHEERAPAGPLERLANQEGSEQLMVTFPAALQNLLLKHHGPIGLPFLQINKDSVRMILEAIRNTILKWSLKLENDGIVGDGISFSPEEKQKAAQDVKDLGPQISITIENMIDSVIQQGSPGATVRTRRET